MANHSARRGISQYLGQEQEQEAGAVGRSRRCVEKEIDTASLGRGFAAPAPAPAQTIIVVTVSSYC